MKKLPKGKGLYVWNIVDMPDGWVDKLLKMGITWIAGKIANGISSSNRRQLDSGGWADDILEPFVDQAKAAGMLVYGWQYVYCFSPLDEAEKAAERVKRFGLDGFIIDAEHQCYGKHDEAFFYSKRLRELMPNVPIGLSTYRFPKLHPRLPYKEFLDICDFNAPQVYWNADKAGVELAESHRQYAKIKPLPFIPAGRSYYGEGFPKPTPAETTEFLTVARGLNCPAAFFWSADTLYHRLKPLPEIRKAIADYEWDGNGEPIPPVEPPTDSETSEMPDVITLNGVELRFSGLIYESHKKYQLTKKE